HGFIEHRGFEGDNIIRAKNSGIGQNRHAGKTKAVTNRGHMRSKGQMHRLACLKGRKGLACADGTGFLEGMEIGLIDFQAARRGYLETAPALVALLEMQMNITWRMLIFDQSMVRAG